MLGHGFFLMLQIADPEYRKRIKLPRNIVSESAMLLGVTTSRLMENNGDWERVILAGNDLRALNPAIYKQRELGEDIFVRLLSGFEVALEDRDAWGSGVPPDLHALNLAILFPNNRKTIEGSSRIADAIEEDHVYALNREYWNDYIHTAAAMRIAFPKAFNRYRGNIYETLEQKVDVEQYLGSGAVPIRDPNIQDRVINAAHLRILLAEDVRVTNRGLFLKMPMKKAELKSTSVPVRRRF
jgi:hypothetical protein